MEPQPPSGPSETVRSRFAKVLNGAMPEDRLPVIEWATWWDLTVNQWRSEGLPEDLDKEGIKRWFGLDVDYQAWLPSIAANAPPPADGEPWVRNEGDYEALLPFLYPDPVPFDRGAWRGWAKEHSAGDCIAWITLDGFFWFPRSLLGIEPHFYAFFDQPELLKRMARDLAEYHHRCIEEFCQVCVPDFMTFAEDMSYNHGPMLSNELFDDFLAPYYRIVVPELERRGIVPLIDSDGDVEPMIPWLEEVGIRGILPLERMAGVDVARIRANHPNWIMIGGFDKTVMHRGRRAVRNEFDRLMPTLVQSRFVPSVDHQTPPEVSLSEYRDYLAILREVATEVPAKWATRADHGGRVIDSR